MSCLKDQLKEQNLKTKQKKKTRKLKYVHTYAFLKF